MLKSSTNSSDTIVQKLAEQIKNLRKAPPEKTEIAINQSDKSVPGKSSNSSNRTDKFRFSLS
tara:strand:- start:47 stop:232 length:186 start_codon:yes stop_codon:yes gene_type:complete